MQNPRYAGARFVGRGRELAAIAELLGAARLVTLTGPGGVGKTRLALEAAAALGASYPGGVAVVELAALRDPALVRPAIVRQLGRLGAPGQLTPDAEGGAAAARLLLLDNLEHLLAAAPEIAELLAGSPQLSILATSRAPLRIGGEHELPVAPLDLPLSHGPVAAAQILATPAGELFVERARRARPDFAPTDANAGAIAAICRQLDGLPLAIELAAARMQMLPPQALLARLDRRLALLSGGPRDAPERQRTLRDTIAWSYDLLTPPAQRLFRALAVFSGGASLEAIEALGARLEADLVALIDALAELCDHQLLRPDGSDAEPRYSMLEVVREYAGELLADAGEEAALRAWHSGQFLALAERAGPELTGREQQAWMQRLGADDANLRAALAWARAQGRAGAVLRAGAALWRYWWLHGGMAEGRALLGWALASAEAPIGGRLRADGLLAAGFLTNFQSDLAEARALLEESLALYEEAGDRAGVAAALNSLGLVAFEQEDDATAQARFEACLAIRRTLGDLGATALPLHNLAAVALRRGDLTTARERYELAAQVLRSSQNQGGLALALLHLAGALVRLDDTAAARARLSEALALAEGLGARTLLIEGVEVAARLATITGQAGSAVQLFAAAEAARARHGAPQTSGELMLAAEHVRLLRWELGPSSLADGWRAGRALDLGQAVALARATLRAESRPAAGAAPPSAPAPRPTPGTSALTERERDVLALLVEGHPNKVIAEQLQVSPYTVHAHLRAIFGKLDVRTRSAAVRHALDRRLLEA